MERFFVTCSHNYVALKAYLETLPIQPKLHHWRLVQN